MLLVVKIGGAGTRMWAPSQNGGDSGPVTQDPGLISTMILDEIAQLVKRGERIVLVHGGSGLTDQLSQQLGHPTRTITSPGGITSRYTDPETLRIYAMAVTGEINTEIVALLQGRGVNAIGLAGVDGRLLVARRKDAVRAVTPEGRVQVVRDSYTGQIEHVNGPLLRQLLDAGYTPVIAPLALGTEGERLNVDGDRAAAAIAAALHADALAIMTNVPGLLTDPEDHTTLVQFIPVDRLEEYAGYARGRMHIKLLGAQEALRGGVGRVHISSRSLLATLDGAGTTIEAAHAAVLPDRSVYDALH